MIWIFCICYLDGIFVFVWHLKKIGVATSDILSLSFLESNAARVLDSKPEKKKNLNLFNILNIHSGERLLQAMDAVKKKKTQI